MAKTRQGGIDVGGDDRGAHTPRNGPGKSSREIHIARVHTFPPTSQHAYLGHLALTSGIFLEYLGKERERMIDGGVI